MPAQQGSGMDQPSGRRAATVFDQHKIPGHPLFANGRPWACYIDKRSGFPVGVIQPKGWSAPWLPPQGEYFRFDKNDPTRFVINYTKLLEERMSARAGVLADRRKAALARGWDVDDPEKQEALDVLVDTPRNLNTPEIIKACMDGNLWILGASETDTHGVKQYLPEKRSVIDNLKSQLPDFGEKQSLANDIDALMDIEEAVDPQATPRGVVRNKKQKPLTPAA